MLIAMPILVPITCLLPLGHSGRSPPARQALWRPTRWVDEQHMFTFSAISQRFCLANSGNRASDDDSSPRQRQYLPAFRSLAVARVSRTVPLYLLLLLRSDGPESGYDINGSATVNY